MNKSLLAAALLAIASGAQAGNGKMYTINEESNGVPVIKGTMEVYQLPEEPDKKIAFVLTTVAGVCLLTFLEFHGFFQCVTLVSSLTQVYNFSLPRFIAFLRARVRRFFSSLAASTASCLPA